jgi:hypothetical protein
MVAGRLQNSGMLMNRASGGVGRFAGGIRFDSPTGEYVNLITKGIIDSTKVVLANPTQRDRSQA